VALKSQHDITNSLVLFSSAGEVLSSYAKIHPFSITQEGSCYKEGSSIVFKSLKETSLEFTICYDLRFSEIHQALSNSSDIIVNIANWPEVRKDHWESLLRARAIENQVFMVGINRTGTDGNGIKYFRGSQVFDPTGNPVKPIDTWGDVDIFELNLSLVRKTRESFPVKHDRKNEFYKCLY
jgi:omega-amidase